MTERLNDLQRDLEDPSKYVVVRGVPVFAAHERKVKVEGVERKVKVDEARLQQIAAVCNQRWATSRTPIVVTAGHRLSDPSTPEQMQPTVLGYGLNLRVEPGPGDQPLLVYDQYIRRDCEEAARSFPFRSAEYYPDTGLITGVALLRRDAFLDLGVVSYSRGCGWVQNGQPLPRPPRWVPSVSNGPRVFYQAENKMPAPAIPSPTNVQLPDDEDVLTPDEQKQAEKFMRHYAKHHKWVGYAMKKYAAENTPEHAAPAPAPAPALKPDDALKHQADAAAIKYAALERQVQQQTAAMEAIQLNYARERASGIVKQLVFEGYQIRDVGAEVEKIARMTDSQRLEREQEIRLNYQRSPVGAGWVPVVPDANEGAHPSTMTMTESQLGKVIEYVRANPGVTFEQAEAAVKAVK